MNTKNDTQSATSPDLVYQDCLLQSAIVSCPIVVKSSALLSEILDSLHRIRREIEQLSGQLSSQDRLTLRLRASYIIVSHAENDQTNPWVGYLSESSILEWLGKAQLDETLTAVDFMHPMTVEVATTDCPSPQQLLEVFQTQGIALMPVFEQGPVPVGFITPDSLKSLLDTQTWLLSYRVEDAMVPVAQISSEASVLDALQWLARRDVPDYLVLTQTTARGAIPIGMVNRQDILRLSLHSPDWMRTSVASLVSAPLQKLTVGQPLGLAHQVLSDHDINALVVVDSHGRLQGLINRRSIVALLNPQHLYATIQQLQNQVTLVNTQQQQQQRQYQIQLDNLGDRVQTALNKEKELKAFQQQFIAHAAHEFRTPLAVIASSAGILRDFGDRLDVTKKQTHLQRIQTYVNQTTQMLDQLLQVEHTLSDQMRCELNPLDLPNWCKGLIDELKAATCDRTITGLFDIMAPAVAVVALDENLLRQILCNVLSNAIKYSEASGLIKLNVHIREDIVVFNIQDDGIGISEADQPFVFQPFYRSDHVSQIAGTGLGLTIAKNCVTSHGGYINLTSTLGQGTRVDIVIPNSR
ncbi:MAG: ATP-binding protein [Cyanobacteria bacterium P01_F01_bin.4]